MRREITIPICWIGFEELRQMFEESDSDLRMGFVDRAQFFEVKARDIRPYVMKAESKCPAYTKLNTHWNKGRSR